MLTRLGAEDLISYIALLRGVNVGGNSMIDMKQLKAAYTEAGFTEVRTHINSGNVIFFSGKDADAVQSMCECLIVERFGLNIAISILMRLIKSDGYAYTNACLEDVGYQADRKLDKSTITRLGSCNYVQEHHNIIILGATGSGKTYLANAFGIAANRDFLTVRYVRLPELLTELAISRAEGNYRKVFKQYRNVNLLILDEWLLFPLKEPGRIDALLETDYIIYVMEFKYSDCPQDAAPDFKRRVFDKSLAEGMEQIKKKGYAGKYAGSGKNISDGVFLLGQGRYRNDI